MNKIELPIWTYNVLKERKNVALPDMCMGIDRKSLKRHLERKCGFKIKIREATYLDNANSDYGKRRTIKKTYLIAEAQYGRLEIGRNEN